jgi:beta-xylosidase
MAARPRTLVRLVPAAIVLLASLLAPTPAHASVGSDPFTAGQVYRGEFGAPSLLQVGSTYYAFGTNTAGDNVPAMTSKDLVTWRARPGWPVGRYSTWAGYNDAFPKPASFAIYRPDVHGKPRTSVWAPSVAKVGATYVMAYVIPISPTSDKRCISLATSSRPLGPYVDRRSGPIVCSSDPLGSIDPQVYQPRDGVVYLIWKNAGVPGSTRTKIWSRRMNAQATAFAAGSRPHFLLQTRQPWEGHVIEAPAMQRFHGRYYLFYSGNRFVTAYYATGYAICAGPLGPCHRPTTHPLLATGGTVAGPGAASALVDATGHLRLAYSAWDRGHVGYPSSTACRNTSYGCNQRRLHIATLWADRKGLLHVSARG